MVWRAGRQGTVGGRGAGRACTNWRRPGGRLRPQRWGL